MAAAEARVQLCDPTLDSILTAANLMPCPSPSTNPQDSDAVMHGDFAHTDEQACRTDRSSGGVQGSMQTPDGSCCYLAHAAALSVAAQRLSALHTEQKERVTSGRKRTAGAAGLEVGEDGEPPQAAVTALSPMLSMHAVPALRHEAFKALTASAGQELSLICLAAAATSDVTASGLATRAPLTPLPTTASVHRASDYVKSYCSLSSSVHLCG